MVDFFGKIKDFVVRYRKYLTVTTGLIGLVLVCVLSLLIGYFTKPSSPSVSSVIGSILVPFQKGVNEIGRKIFDNEQERLSLEEAEARIASLEAENKTLNRQVYDLSALLLENEELRALLGAKERLSSYEVTMASVIGSDGVNCFHRFTINAGSADGMEVDMNVVNEDGLVGIITYVGLNYSIVTSILEDGMNVSAMTRNHHDTCIVTGDLSLYDTSELRLDRAKLSVRLEEDKTLVTSHISDKFLPGLLIGYAENIRANDDLLTQSATVQTAVDFSSLKEVLVIRTKKSDLTEDGDE